MNEPTWKLLELQPVSQNQTVSRTWPDGRYECCLVTATEYLKWLEAGNVPIPADEQPE